MTSTPDAGDMRLWKEAKTLAVDSESGIISWFFDTVLSTITVVSCKAIEVRQVSSRVFKELAVFDIMATFWESLQPAEKDGQMANLTLYHKLLRQAATYELCNQHLGVTCILNSPSILQPWLKRTLCLLGHDDSSRKLLESFQYPPYLLDDGKLRERLIVVSFAEFTTYLQLLNILSGSHSFRQSSVVASPILLEKIHFTGVI
jgi:hypothetical protein